MKKIFLLLGLIPVIGFAQSAKLTRIESGEGIHFESGLSWIEIQAKAKAENKFIFMDCYATWCGPCKFMSDSIFTREEVGGYMNDHFLNVAVQTDQTTKDGDDVKKWYTDARSIVEKYSIRAFPTYLFFSPDGNLAHRVVGVTGKEAKDFIAKVEEALNPQKQYYNLVESYMMHLNDTGFLRQGLILAINAYDRKNAEEIGNAYVNCLKNPYNKSDLELIRRAIYSSKDKGFYLFLNNAFRIDSVLEDQSLAEYTISNVIASEDILPLIDRGNTPIVYADIVRKLKYRYPSINSKALNFLYKAFEIQVERKEIVNVIYKEGAEPADWTKILFRIQEHYPGFNPDKIIASEKPKYYLKKKKWTELDKSVVSYVDKYGDQLGNGDLNDIAWRFVFLHSTNRDLLLKALKWSQQTIPNPIIDTVAYDDNIYEYMDTYANLLYKLGDSENAILLEKKVVELSQKFADGQANQINFKVTLQRMESHQNTWEGRNNREQYE